MFNAFIWNRLLINPLIFSFMLVIDRENNFAVIFNIDLSIFF